MSDEGFPAFAQNFRIFYSSVLAFSASSIAALVLFVSRVDGLNNLSVLAFLVGISCFIATVLVMIFCTYLGLRHECSEGESTKSKSQRDINKGKLSMISWALVPFSIGVLSLLFLLLPPFFHWLEF